MKRDAWKYSLNTVIPVTVTFGYLLNAERRLARWGMLLGTKPNKDRRHTHLHSRRVSVSWESQHYHRINYWLVAGGVLLH